RQRVVIVQIKKRLNGRMHGEPSAGETDPCTITGSRRWDTDVACSGQRRWSYDIVLWICIRNDRVQAVVASSLKHDHQRLPCVARRRRRAPDERRGKEI